MGKDIPPILLNSLKTIEPNAVFSGAPPKILSSSGSSYFTKAGSPTEVEQYVGEVESLKAIETAAPGLAPRVLLFTKDEMDRPIFISEYKYLTQLDDASARALATRLATELHAHKSVDGFGFHVPTFCGATQQRNGWHESWEKCFSGMISNLLDHLKDQGPAYQRLCTKGERLVLRVIPELLGSLEIEPVLLHGDLWSGNVGMDEEHRPVIFDPSSYYGHNEADLAIARIFGGFPSSFFTTYHALRPKTNPVNKYARRADLYELYHYLNHTVLFGGGYASSAENIMDRLLGGD